MASKRAIDAVTNKLSLVLKEKQLEAILEFLSGKDVFVCLPTGYGKSLIYGILPLVYDELKDRNGSIVVCVSPLTSLMMDQREKFSPKGITTNFVGEDQIDQTAIHNVLNGEIQLVYISPESLVCISEYRNMLLSPAYQERLVALVVDEAHCVKMWGDSFRVAYAHIRDIRSILPSHVNIMALTATATKETYDVVCSRLSMKNPSVIGCAPNRDNIFYALKLLPNMDEFAETISNNVKKLGLYYPKTVVFCQKYADCSTLYHFLRKHLRESITYPPNYPIVQQFVILDMYTRATTVERKEKIISTLCDPNGTLRIIIATTAFGMGIDCSDIRVVLHWEPPSTLEQYAQETGRAGRDGLPSEAVLYCKTARKHLSNEMKSYCENKEQCRRKLLYSNFFFIVLLFAC